MFSDWISLLFPSVRDSGAARHRPARKVQDEPSIEAV